MNNWVKKTAVALLVAVLIELVPVVSVAQDDKTSVTNVRFEVNGELVQVYYDLEGTPDRVHKIRLMLLRETDSLFLYRPVNLTGDVGTVVFPGKNRRIIWEFTKEFPDGMTGNDFYFVVEAERVPTEGINPIYYYAGGAALVGTLLIVLLGGKNDTGGEVATDFPAPPGRPQ
jgi:hypothetical protein